MMIQNTTFLRRAVGSLLVALVTLVGFQANAQFDFQSTTSVSWAETDAVEGRTGGDSLTNLNLRVDDAVSQDATDACYTLSGSAAYAFAFETAANCRSSGAATGTMNGVTGNNDAPNIVMKTSATAGQSHLDFERGKTQVLEVNGHRGTGAALVKSTLTVNITITDYDERPDKTQAMAPTWYWTPDDSGTLLVSSLFKDPEGSPVFFDPTAARNTDIWICDAEAAGDLTIESTVADPGRPTADPAANGPGTAATVTAGTAEGCTVSNPLRQDDTALPVGGFKGGPGNRVVSTSITGPVLTIKADSLVTAPDATTDPTPRTRGTYAAKVFIRAWSHSVAANPVLSPAEFAMVNIQVKVGANNVPQFAGGATGYKVEFEEGDDTSGPMTAWVAGDLDAGGDVNDKLEYNLVGGGDKKTVEVAGGTVTLVHTEANDTASPPVVESLTLNSKGLDYEDTTSFRVYIQVTDNWSAPVMVPVDVTLTNVNELERALKADGKTTKVIEDQKMVMGLKRTFDLNDYFVDPEGDNITFEAFTNIRTDVVSVDDDGVLTITGPPAGTYTATITATDDGTPSAFDTYDFEIASRDANAAPVITLVKDGTIAIGATVDENGKAGEVVATVAYTDDGPAPTANLTPDSHFTATVDDEKKMVSIATKAGLNYEAEHGGAARHVLKLSLTDAWEPETKMSKSLEIQVSVTDQNDAPTVKTEGMGDDAKPVEIPDVSIVVNGSGSLYTGDHFEDQDGDRLLINASSSDMEKVMVSVSGLDKVSIMGVAETEEEMPVTVTLTATDPDGAFATLTFKVTVGANNPPVADADAFMMALPENNTINVGSTADIDLDGLFTEPDTGDEITSITAMTSDEDILLVVSTNDGDSITLVGRASGMATLTITAMDGGGNSTSEMADITVNEAPAESMPIEPIEMDRTMPHVVDISGVFTDGDDGARHADDHGGSHWRRHGTCRTGSHGRPAHDHGCPGCNAW